jgi:hypothetical protein
LFEGWPIPRPNFLEEELPQLVSMSTQSQLHKGNLKS